MNNSFGPFIKVFMSMDSLMEYKRTGYGIAKSRAAKLEDIIELYVPIECVEVDEHNSNWADYVTFRISKSF
jgi:hypothetical protein